MSFGILNLLMLFGLLAVAIPPLIHLLNRRRYDVIDWGAMQFLQISDAKRRRLLIEEVLLMLLRMGLIAVMVLALCAPFVISPYLDDLGLRKNRDAVLIFGGSAGMEATGAHEAAKKWALAFIDNLAPGDSVVILQAKRKVVEVLAEPTTDFDLARKTIENLPPPGGGCDWPQAVQKAYQVLETSQRPLRNIILLGDGQRYGWSDEKSKAGWVQVARLHQDARIKPSVPVLNFDPRRTSHPVNWSLAPLRAKRATAYVRQDVEFQTDLLQFGGRKYLPPRALFLEVDGDRWTRRKLRFPDKADSAKAAPGGTARDRRPDVLRVSLPPFKQQFRTAGSHLVSVVARLQSGREIRQNYAVEVLSLPVLIVDGTAPAGGDTRPDQQRSKFLRVALDPRQDAARDPLSAMLARVVPVEKFTSEMLYRDIEPARPNTRPRVLILANVPRLSPAQQQGVAQFLEAGGGVLVTLGDQAEKNKQYYNDALYNRGNGWLPARLERVIKAGARQGASPRPATFSHSALRLFRQESFGGLNDAYFPRWWVVTRADGKTKGVTAARLNSDDPFLVEGHYKNGRVLLCAVPLTNSVDNKDPSWDTNLVRLPVFVPLVHELVSYLAGNLPGEDEVNNLRLKYNLRPGQPLLHALGRGEATDSLRLATPGDAPRPVVFEGARGLEVHLAQLQSGPETSSGSLKGGRQLLVYRDTAHTGVYTLWTPHYESERWLAPEIDGFFNNVFRPARRRADWLPQPIGSFFNGVLSSRRKIYYTVQGADRPRDWSEYDLTPATAEERAAVARQVPPDDLDEDTGMTYETDGTALLTRLADQSNTQELWWVFMLAVILLLCAEVWLTRRIVRAR
jgi:hypothetical protein